MRWRWGRRLDAGLVELAGRRPGLLAWRHAGLFFGIDIGLDGMAPAERRVMALNIVNALRDDGVLISTTGANEDTLKVRPPLVCEASHVDRFLQALGDALAAAAP